MTGSMKGRRAFGTPALVLVLECVARLVAAGFSRPTGPPKGRHYQFCDVLLALVLVVCGWTAGIRAQQPASDLSKPKVPLVIVVGCASRSAQGSWTLTNATSGSEAKLLFMSAKEIEDARKTALGTNSYRLLGTPEFLTKEELLKQEQRAQFTGAQVANATGQLQDGRKLVVKALLITAQNEKRLNLVAVQQLADTCKR